jgi:1,4-alpha-glucan branching enzyme
MIVRVEHDEGQIQVAFRIPDHGGADRANVVGDFNDWSIDATPMAHTENGFEAELRLTAGRSYRFRYLLDGERWQNDWDADDYVDNDFGGSDSVLDLT